MTWLATFVAALAPLACSPPVEPEASVLELTLRRPKVASGVLLNEEVIAYFSEELDPSTVTPTSVRIVDEHGRRASGRREVEGRELHFIPDPVYRADLSDGGFRPGTRYTVELRGFPDPGCLRALDGAPLASTVRWSFTTVSVEEGDVAFHDDTPGRGGALTMMTQTLVADGAASSLLLSCSEPIDPSTVHDDDFLLTHTGSGQTVGLRAALRAPPTERLRPEDILARPKAAWLELLPLERLEPGATYRLDIPPDHRLRDYGGHPVWVSIPPRKSQVRVAAGATRLPGSYRESFLDAARRSPIPPPAGDRPWDGMAHWASSGRCGIRYPAAAGDGRDGAVELEGRATDASLVDLQATTLSISGEVKLTAPGLVVLRSQGLLRVSGRLFRLAAGGDTSSIPSMKDSFRGGTLSDWLTRARAEDPCWLVLIAGGDLVIEGDIGIDTPVLCVAGGVVRSSGAGELTAENEFWILGEGRLSPRITHKNRPVIAERARLVMDAPTNNPLVAPVSFAVMSGPLPPRGKVVRWLAATVGGHSGRGGYRVRYLRDADLVPGQSAAGLELVDDPRFLDDASPIRFLIELTLSPGGVEWDPPFVDEIALSWEEDRR